MHNNKKAPARTVFMLRREASTFAKLTLCFYYRQNLNYRLQRSAKREPCFRIFFHITVTLTVPPPFCPGEK